MLSNYSSYSLRKKYLYSKLFRSAFSCIQTEYGEISSICPTIYSLFMFVSFLVLMIHMLFANEGKPNIFKSIKAAHIKVEWMFATGFSSSK